MKDKMRLVAVGGTFDEFHKGHRTILLKAFQVGEKVLIGLTTDNFVRKLYKSHDIAPYKERLKKLRQFLKINNLTSRAEIIPLDDPYGPTVYNSEIDVLVVSRETAPIAYEINEKRRIKGLRSLRIIVIDMVLAEDDKTISTTRIWRGEIDHEGRVISL